MIAGAYSLKFLLTTIQKYTEYSKKDRLMEVVFFFTKRCIGLRFCQLLFLTLFDIFDFFENVFEKQN